MGEVSALTVGHDYAESGGGRIVEGLDVGDDAGMLQLREESHLIVKRLKGKRGKGEGGEGRCQ